MADHGGIINQAQGQVKATATCRGARLVLNLLFINHLQK